LPKLSWSGALLAWQCEVFRRVKYNNSTYAWVLWETTGNLSFVDDLINVESQHSEIDPLGDWVAYKVRSVSSTGHKSSFSAIRYYTVETSGGVGPPRL
ncbi:MAG: hypothetical protein GY765_31230, partial [bacterium]|nr:hypothetical protein [bacterium]